MIFSTLGKKSANSFFFCLKFFNAKKNLLRVTIFRNQIAAELTCTRKTRKIVEENGEQILRKENKKNKKENGLQTPLVPKEDKKGLNKPQTTIFHLLTDKIGGKWEHWRDARIPR